MKFLKKISKKSFLNSGLFLNLKIATPEQAAELIGINLNTLKYFLEENERDNSENAEFNKLIYIICTEIKDQEFRLKILSKMLFIKEYGQFTIFKNGMRGKLKKDKTEYVLEVSVSHNNIEFNVFGESITLGGEYLKTDNNIVIKYKNETIGVYENIIKKTTGDLDVCDINTIEEINYYNLNYVQLMKYIKTIKEKYMSDRKSGKQFFEGLNGLENYIEKTYYVRAGQNYILKRSIREDKDEEPIENYFIGQNEYPSIKKLYVTGDYAWISKRRYDKYCNGQCNVEELWESRIKGSQKKIGRK